MLVTSVLGERGASVSLPCSPLSSLLSYFAGVQSALYGLVLSLLICVAAVAVFTTHVLLLLPVLLSILGMCGQGDGAPGMASARAHGRRQQAGCGYVVGGTVGQAGGGWDQVGVFLSSRQRLSLSFWPPSLSKGLVAILTPICLWHPVGVTCCCVCVLPLSSSLLLSLLYATEHQHPS